MFGLGQSVGHGRVWVIACNKHAVARKGWSVNSAGGEGTTTT